MASQFQLGERYFKGEGTAVNFTEAAKWYQKAAESNHADAQFALSSMYQHGIGVTQDNAHAAKWLQAAADHGHTRARDELAKYPAR